VAWLGGLALLVLANLLRICALYFVGLYAPTVFETAHIEGASRRRRTRSAPSRQGQLSVASFNVENLDPSDPSSKFTELADLIKNNLGSPDLLETLPPAERYSYVFSGNSQVLDHLMVSAPLVSALVGFDVVHANAEFSTRESDQDPAVARFNFAAPASVPSGSDGHLALLALALSGVALSVLARGTRRPAT
jgi:predicted extracellular nuclease